MRTASRSPVTLKIKFKSTSLEQFIERYSVDISHGGIFIRTKDPLPVGTNLRFEFQLKDASPLITGDGTVVWTRDFDPTRSGVAPGMGVRFDRLPSESQDVLEQILAHKTAKLGKPEGFLDTPTKVAFGNVPTRAVPTGMLDTVKQPELRRSGAAPAKPDDTTPLPPALPFHNELDEFPDEAFEEATKVAALDALARRSAVNEQQANGEDAALPPFGKSLDDDVTLERHAHGRTMPRATPSDESDPDASAAATPDPAGRDGLNGRAERAPQAPADPFSLPSAADGSDAAARRGSRSLRLVDEPAAGAPRAASESDAAPEAQEATSYPGAARRPRRSWATPRRRRDRSRPPMRIEEMARARRGSRPPRSFSSPAGSAGFCCSAGARTGSSKAAPRRRSPRRRQRTKPPDRRRAPRRGRTRSSRRAPAHRRRAGPERPAVSRLRPPST